MKAKNIFTNGCFDVLHRGHLELLRYCSTLGCVTVGLNSDSSTQALKGPKRPYSNEKDRKFMLESLKYVDKVIIFEEETPLRLIQELKPDIIVKGGDYEPHAVIGCDISEVIIFKYVDEYSTTKAIQNFVNR